MDIQAALELFIKENPRGPFDRAASFDYCYSYFQGFRQRDETASLADPEYLEKSCLQLGFYLASWGMLRGSTFLFNSSVRQLVPIIKVIANTKKEVWDIDVEGYSPYTINLLTEVGDNLFTSLASERDLKKSTMSNILKTKIMLGVFGNVPAYDNNVKTGLSKLHLTATFGHKSIRQIGDFYKQHSSIIETFRHKVLSFDSGEESTNLRYPQARVIDMALFQIGVEEQRRKSGEERRRKREAVD